MKTRRLTDASAFLDRAGPDLLRDEIRHGLTYGIAERVAANSQAFGTEAPWFVVVQDTAGLCATAICTPPHRVILSHFRGDANAVCAALIPSIHDLDASIPGVVGEKKLAGKFTRDWGAAYGSTVKDMMAQRIYKLTEVNRLKSAPGILRKAILDDLDRVASWSAAFETEAVGEEPAPALKERVRERIIQDSIYLWEDGEPVSMALWARPTGNGISIGGVYTPPPQRGHGYATSCVASLCGKLLQEYSFCTLYTDLSNPVSNSIYKRIGFKEYCDSTQYSYAQEKAS